MLESIKTWLMGQNIMVSIGTVFITIALILSGVSKILGSIDNFLQSFKDKTTNTWDNALDAKVVWLLALCEKGVAIANTVNDWLSMNRAH